MEIFISSLAAPLGVRDLSSPSGDRTRALGSESAESLTTVLPGSLLEWFTTQAATISQVAVPAALMIARTAYNAGRHCFIAEDSFLLHIPLIYVKVTSSSLSALGQGNHRPGFHNNGVQIDAIKALCSVTLSASKRIPSPPKTQTPLL